MGAINSELQKHPVPKDIDSKKLRQLLVGKWKITASHLCLSRRWQLANRGQPINPGDLSGPIILLNQDYFIYSSQGSVFFHSRVKE
jgi:hypothetical protein